MAFPESEIELTINTSDFDFEEVHTPKFSEEKPEETPFEYHPNPDHVVVTEFRIEEKAEKVDSTVAVRPPTPTPKPKPIVYLELHSKSPNGTQYQFLYSKPAQITNSTWFTDYRFFENHLQQMYGDLLKTEPYIHFPKHKILVTFHNPEITYFHIQDKQFRLIRYSHPASQEVQANTPPPVPQSNGHQTQYRVAIYVEIRTESSPGCTIPDLGFTTAEEPYIRAILEDIRRARNFWRYQSSLSQPAKSDKSPTDILRRDIEDKSTQNRPSKPDTNQRAHRGNTRTTNTASASSQRRSRSPAQDRNHRPGHYTGNFGQTDVQPDTAGHRRQHRDTPHSNRSDAEDLRHDLSRRERRTVVTNFRDRSPRHQSPEYHQWDRRYL